MSRTTMKTGTYGIMHVTVATTLAYIITGNLTAALSIGLIEPCVQTFTYFFHERVWSKVPVKSRLGYIPRPLGRDLEEL